VGGYYAVRTNFDVGWHNSLARCNEISFNQQNKKLSIGPEIPGMAIEQRTGLDHVGWFSVGYLGG
jgi:hypothetical protein